MIRQEVSVKDFYKIAKDNEYFLWHFLQKEQESTRLLIWSIFKENKVIHQDIDNALVHILDKINIPYFESYVEDSIDFLMDMGLDSKLLWSTKKYDNLYVDKKFYEYPEMFSTKLFEPQVFIGASITFQIIKKNERHATSIIKCSDKIFYYDN